MNNNYFANLISNMGSSHSALIEKGLIPETELVHLYEDGDTMELEIAPGVELVFYSETQRFEMITLSFKRSSNNVTADFKASLPKPLERIENQTEVHKELGAPMFTKSQLDLFPTELYGWDVYQLDSSLHPEGILDIQYNKEMQISNIHISLMNKNV